MSVKIVSPIDPATGAVLTTAQMSVSDVGISSPLNEAEDAIVVQVKNNVDVTITSPLNEDDDALLVEIQNPEVEIVGPLDTDGGLKVHVMNSSGGSSSSADYGILACQIPYYVQGYHLTTSVLKTTNQIYDLKTTPVRDYAVIAAADGTGVGDYIIEADITISGMTVIGGSGYSPTMQLYLLNAYGMNPSNFPTQVGSLGAYYLNFGSNYPMATTVINLGADTALYQNDAGQNTSYAFAKEVRLAFRVTRASSVGVALRLDYLVSAQTDSYPRTQFTMLVQYRYYPAQYDFEE